MKNKIFLVALILLVSLFINYSVISSKEHIIWGFNQDNMIKINDISNKTIIINNFNDFQNLSANVTFQKVGLDYQYSGVGNFSSWQSYGTITNFTNSGDYVSGGQYIYISGGGTVSQSGNMVHWLPVLTYIPSKYMSYNISYDYLQDIGGSITSCRAEIAIFLNFNDSSTQSIRSWVRESSGTWGESSYANGVATYGKFIDGIFIYIGSYLKTGSSASLFQILNITIELYTDNRNYTALFLSRTDTDKFNSDGFYISNDTQLDPYQTIFEVNESISEFPLILYWDNNTSSWLSKNSFIGTNQSFLRFMINFTSEPTDHLRSFVYNITVLCGYSPYYPPVVNNLLLLVLQKGNLLEYWNFVIISIIAIGVIVSIYILDKLKIIKLINKSSKRLIITT